MEFVNYHKQNRIRTTAEIYLSQYPTDLQPRFDVVEIYAPEGVYSYYAQGRMLRISTEYSMDGILGNFGFLEGV